MLAGRLSHLAYAGITAAQVLLGLLAWQAIDTWAAPVIGAVLLFAAVMLVIAASAAVRRYHDLDEPGWSALALLLPGWNLWQLYRLLGQRGVARGNEHGTDPLEPVDEVLRVAGLGKKTCAEHGLALVGRDVCARCRREQGARAVRALVGLAAGGVGVLVALGVHRLAR